MNITTKQTKQLVKEMAKEENKSESQVINEAVRAYRFDKKWQKIRYAKKEILKDFANVKN